jgi:hypothetical protein
LLILLLGSLAVLADVNRFFIPVILAQKDLRLFAALEPFFNFDGLVVTAIDNLDPGLAALYEAIPFLFNPPEGFTFFTLPRWCFATRCHFNSTLSS